MNDRFLFIDNGFDAFIFIVIFFFLLHLRKTKDLLRSLRLKMEKNAYISFFLFAIFMSRRKKPIYLIFLEIKIHLAYKLKKILMKITLCSTKMS